MGGVAPFTADGQSPPQRHFLKMKIGVIKWKKGKRGSRMRSISFTGHKKLSEDVTELKRRLYQRLEGEIKNGVTDFNTGGTAGFDCLSAATVLKLREVYPDIKLHLILPCSNEEQTEKWSEDEKLNSIAYLTLPILLNTHRSIIITAV